MRVEEAPFVTEPVNTGAPRARAGAVRARGEEKLDGKRLEEEPNDTPATRRSCR